MPAPTVSRPLKPLKPPMIHAASAILIDAVSGQVLYEKNADVERPMASTTKIMTALLFCENVPEDANITASHNACYTGGSSLHLHSGERVCGRDMLHAILMRSANDACVAAAEYIAGSEAAFVARMNERAQELGALHTHFANSHGLNDPDHYTTARDLATIARAAMQNPRIREVVRTRYYRIVRSTGSRDTLMRNHSHFLGKYPGADGIKTGWTIPAGHCYAGSATRNGWQLISVVLKSPDYVHETASLMNYGFANFEPHIVAKTGDVVGHCEVTGGVLPTVPVTVKSPVQFVIRKGQSPEVAPRIALAPARAPIEAGVPVGTMELYRAGKQIASAPLVTMTADPAPPTITGSRKAGPWKSAALATTIFTVGLVSLRYGTRVAALTKSARRRRRRLAQSLRGDDRLG